MKQHIKPLIVLVCLAFVVNTFAQTDEVIKKVRTKLPDTIPDGWTVGGVSHLNFSQTSLTNWAAGGQNSFSVNGLVSLYADLKAGKNTWQSSLDLGYGILRQGGKEARFIKTDDKIDLYSKYGRKAFGKWYYAGIVNFRTQMTRGFNYPNDSVKISDFLAPAYILTAAGLDFDSEKGLRLFISPFTGKFTIVNSQGLANKGAYGVEAAETDTAGNIIEEGKNFRSEIGAYLRVSYKKAITEDIEFNTKLDLFSNYANNPQNIDVNWETLIIFKVNKFINASISTHLIYDDDIKIAVDKNDDGIVDSKGPRIQFKEVLAIGLTYKFQNPKAKEKK